MIEEGDKLPDAKLVDADGAEVMLSSLTGKPLVLFFYPRASTPGCTTEAVEFTAARSDFASAGYEIIGISADSPRKLANFRARNDLGVTLLSDEDQDFLEAIGVWKEKKNYGKTYMGIERTTMLVDSDGRVSRIWPKVRVKGHVAEVLEAVRAG